MKRIRVGFAALCLVGALGLLSPILKLGATEKEESPPLRPYLLLDVMNQFQRYADKLYFSGSARNWKLESSALPVIDGRVERYRSERYDAQPLMKAMLIPAIRNVEKAIETKSDADFQRTYSALVQTCNACHAATEHSFVKIVVPTSPIYTNQDYTP